MTPEGIDIEALLKAQGITTGDSTTTEMHVVQMEDSSPEGAAVRDALLRAFGQQMSASEEPEPGRLLTAPYVPSEQREVRAEVGAQAARLHQTLRDRVRVRHPARGDEHPGRRVGLDDVGRGAAGVPRSLDALHGGERRDAYLERVPG